MPVKINTAVAVVDIDFGKSSFHAAPVSLFYNDAAFYDDAAIFVPATPAPSYAARAGRSSRPERARSLRLSIAKIRTSALLPLMKRAKSAGVAQPARYGSNTSAHSKVNAA